MSPIHPVSSLEGANTSEYEKSWEITPPRRNVLAESNSSYGTRFFGRISALGSAISEGMPGIYMLRLRTCRGCYLMGQKFPTLCSSSRQHFPPILTSKPTQEAMLPLPLPL